MLVGRLREQLVEMLGLVIDLTPQNGQEMDKADFGLIPIGSHIAVKCGEIFHHGIYVGIHDNKYRVIYVSGDAKDSAVITKGTIQDFLGKASMFFLIKYENDTSVEERSKFRKRLKVLDRET